MQTLSKIRAVLKYIYLHNDIIYYCREPKQKFPLHVAPTGHTLRKTITSSFMISLVINTQGYLFSYRTLKIVLSRSNILGKQSELSF